MIKFVFWILALILFYAYIGFPILLFAASVIFRRPVKKGAYFPKVSIILSAFNEEKNIEKRLRNLLTMDYPSELLEIIVGSDGAQDQTDKIISEFPSSTVRFFRFVKNMGKPQVLNSLVKEARGNILLFTDVRQEFDSGAVRELVSNFADPEVGCVSGELYFKSESGQKAATAQGMGAYWAYEKFLRKRESSMGSMLGATGAIYAIRRKLFVEIPHDMLVDDMFIPLSIIHQGFRAVFDSEAKAYDKPSEKGLQEFKRKVRTLAGNFQIFEAFPQFLNPLKSPVGWYFISHKVLRLIAPFFLILLLLVNLMLIGHPLYVITMAAQVLFYGFAAFEALRPAGQSRGIGYLPYTFCLLNYSALIAFFRYIKGDYKAAWEKAY